MKKKNSYQSVPGHFFVVSIEYITLYLLMTVEFRAHSRRKQRHTSSSWNSMGTNFHCLPDRKKRESRRDEKMTCMDYGETFVPPFSLFTKCGSSTNAQSLYTAFQCIHQRRLAVQ